MWKSSRTCLLGVALALTAGNTALPAAPVATSKLAGGTRYDYLAQHLVRLDPAFDATHGKSSPGDLLALYAHSRREELVLRADLAPPDFPEQLRRPLDAPGSALVFLVADQEQDNGAATLPSTALRAPVPWQYAVVVSRRSGRLQAQLYGGAGSRNFDTPAFLEPPQLAARLNIVELTMQAPARKAVSAPLRFAAVTLVEGRIEDVIDAAVPGSAAPNAHNVAFVQHGNQGLTYSTVFRGERPENAAFAGDPNNPDDGFDELLAAHEYYSLPGCFHLAATLQSAAAWHDPGFNAWMTQGVAQGWVDLVTSAFAQHMMPFMRDEMNSWSVDIERDMTNWRYSGNAVVAWIPERVWLDTADNDGNGSNAAAGVLDWIGDDFLDNGVQAVVLDQEWHCGYKNNAFDDHHIYTIGTGLKVVPVDNTFVGDVNGNWGNAWNRIVGSTSDELIVYGNDWEFAAEVSQGASNPSALNNYIQILQLCSQNSATVSTWRLSSAIAEPSFGGGSILLQNSTYGLLGSFDGYGGGNNSWYNNWAGYTGSGNLDGHVPKWNYGQIWNNAVTTLLGAPNNSLSQSAWYVMMTNLHETGWHDGGQIAGWQHHYSNHIKNANVFREGSRWAAGQFANPTGAYLDDVDDDGVDEAVVYNDRVFAVFESIGGKAQWVLAKGPGYVYSVVSNDNVYWADTDGDYNEINHTAALSDVSVQGVDRQHDLYALSVVTGSGNTVELRLAHAAVDKRLRLTLGNPYLAVTYNVFGNRAYVKNGFTPDLIDLTWNGRAPLARIWDPDATSQADVGYFGQRNTNTGATAAIVTGDAGAQHNMQFAATLLEGDELLGDGAFEVYLYAGATSPPLGNGHIPELVALRDQLTDTLGPQIVSASYFPTPNRLTLRFNQAARFDNIVLTAIGIDDDNNSVADVTLGAGETVVTTQHSTRIDINVAPATAAAIEALNTTQLELLLAAGAVRDTHANANPNPAVGAADNKSIVFEAATLITIDGRIDPGEWTPQRRLVNDSNDSQWTSANEIDALYMVWDGTYVYFGIDGQVAANSWIFYLDTDVGGPDGQTNLTAIDSWERGATFTATGFRPDYHWGTFQHQSGFDSSSLWRLATPTTSANLSAQALLAFDSQHVFGTQSGSEIAIPWDVLYGLGPGQVPVGARIGFVASICWDPEPNGMLGGDVAPNNLSATLPAIDHFVWLPIDGNNDGVPDPNPVPTDLRTDLEGAPAVVRLITVSPNPFNPQTRISYDLGPEAGRVQLAIHDVRGRLVATLVHATQPSGRYVVRWNGRDSAGLPSPSGVYVVRLATEHGVQTRKVVLLE